MNLLEAVKTESSTTIQELVKTNNTVSNWFDYDALNTALKCGRKDVAKILIQSGCRVHKTTQIPSDTPLHHATELGDLSLVISILERKVPFSINSQGNTPLHLAFLYKHEIIVVFFLKLLARQSVYVNTKNNEGLSHLHIACTQTNKEAIEGFLKNGVAIAFETVNINSARWAGYNAFHFAAEYKSLPAIQALTSSKVNLSSFDQKNAAGKTPLQLLDDQLQETTIMHSLLARKKFSYFHLACTQQNPSNVKKFLDNGVNVNADVSCHSSFCPKETPLHCAVKSKCLENVKLILEHNPDVLRRDIDDKTPLHLAMYSKEDKIVNLLYKANERKDQDMTDKNGLDYFHIACSQNDLETAKKFLDKSKNVNAQVHYNKMIFSHYTALHFAVLNNHEETVKWLIQNGANMNIGKNGIDGTPLHLAFSLGYVDIIELLLKSGADPKIVRQVDDRTALHIIVDCCTNQYEVEKIMPLLSYIGTLVELGIDVNAQDENGDTALHIASRMVYNGCYCLRLLLKFGADVNVRNDAESTPFNLNLDAMFNKEMVQPGDYTILYHHVQKLIALEWIKIDPKNIDCCKVLLSKKHNCDSEVIDFKDDVLEQMEQERVDEVARLKNTKIGTVSLYDFLNLRSKRAAELVNLSATLLKDKKFESRFPVYGYLIKLKHQEAMKYLKTHNDHQQDTDSDGIHNNHHCSCP